MPSEETIRTKLNQLGYHLKKVRKTQPLKKIPETDAIFEQLAQVNAAADADETALRLSIDAKGTILLGVKGVLAESYERIHRSNLIMMGVLPLEYVKGESAASHGLTGNEVFSISGIENDLSPLKKVTVSAKTEDGKEIEFKAIARLDSPIEVAYYQNEGILQYVLRQFLKQ